MAIYIKEIYLPEDPNEIIEFAVKGNGNVFVIGEHFALEACNVQEPHGRMIDESEFFARLDDGIKTISSLPLPEDFVAVYVQLVKEVKEEIGKCRTVIPASEEASA